MARVILITGPSGAGKSTTANRLLQVVDGEWAHISQDDIRDLIKTGYVSANDYYENWSAATKRQYSVSIPICCDMIRRYYEYGINVVCDFFAFPEQLSLWEEKLDDIDYELTILKPDEESVVARNRERNGSARLKDKKIRINHAGFADEKLTEFDVINSTSMTVEQVVNKILSKIDKY